MVQEQHDRINADRHDSKTRVKRSPTPQPLVKKEKSRHPYDTKSSSRESSSDKDRARKRHRPKVSTPPVRDQSLASVYGNHKVGDADALLTKVATPAPPEERKQGVTITAKGKGNEKVKLRLDRKIVELFETPGMPSAIVSVIQHALKIFMANSPGHMAGQATRHYNIATTLDCIGDFRAMQALPDLVAIFRNGKRQFKNRHAPGQDNVSQILTWVSTMCGAGYSLFEGPAWIFGKKIFRTSFDDKRNDLHVGLLWRYCCKFWVACILLEYGAIGREAWLDRRQRKRQRDWQADSERKGGEPETPEAQAQAFEEYKKRRMKRRIRTLYNIFWMPCALNLGFGMPLSSRGAVMSNRNYSWFMGLGQFTRVVGAFMHGKNG